MNLSSYITDNYITVEEIKNKDYFMVYNNANIYKFNNKTRNNIIFSYNVTCPSSNYLLITFKPKYNVPYFSIRVDLTGKIYKLYKSFSSSYLNLSVNPDENYYFMVESDENYKSLNISFKGYNFINYLDYYGLLNNFSSVNYYNSIRLINKEYNYHEMISSILFNFISLNKKDKAIIFKLKPSNFDYLEVQYDFYFIYTNNLKIDNQRQTFKLVKGNEYIFKFCSTSRKINIEIRLKHKYTNILPFDYFIIKQFNSINYKNYNLLHTSNKTFTRTVKDGEIIYTCDHYLIYLFGYLLIQLSPYENIPIFDIKLNYINNNNQKTKYSYSNNIRKNKLFIIAMITVPILIVLIIIIIICYKYKKNSKNLNELNSDNLNQKNDDVYSINDSIKNNEDEEPYNHNNKEDFHAYQEINDYSYNKNNSNVYMFPYDQPYGGQNKNDKQYFNSQNNNQNLGNFTIN